MRASSADLAVLGTASAWRASALAAAVAVVLAACADSMPAPVRVAASPTSPAATEPSAGAGGAAAEQGGDPAAAALIAKPEPAAAPAVITAAVPVDLLPELIPPSRPRKRMNIDQLDAALRRVSGGIGWTAGAGTTGKNELETLALTLGKPNYTDVTTEDLESSALFQKFLGDAAASVCSKRVAMDLAAAPADRMLLVDVDPKLGPAAQPAAVDKALQRALLLYHGRVVAAGAAELTSWRFLLQGASQIAGDPVEGWRAVCAALIQHPAFTSY